MDDLYLKKVNFYFDNCITIFMTFWGSRLLFFFQPTQHWTSIKGHVDGDGQYVLYIRGMIVALGQLNTGYINRAKLFIRNEASNDCITMVKDIEVHGTHEGYETGSNIRF